MSEPNWVSVEELAELNQLAVEDTGEPHLILDYGKLEMAATKASNSFFYEEQTNVGLLATLTCLGVARLHPFKQGNKRTAFEAARLFLFKNGYDLCIDDTIEIADFICDIISRKIPEIELQKLITEGAVPLEDYELYGCQEMAAIDRDGNVYRLQQGSLSR